VWGWALVEQGREEEGTAQICQGLAAYRATGAELGRSHHLSLLVEAYTKAGRIEEASTVLAEALAEMQKSGERRWEVELYRLKGELLLQSSGLSSWCHDANPQSLTSNLQAEAEACFHRAIDIARCQSAKVLELRATMSLSRLWQRQGKTAEARKLLAEVYGWFTEGFDTADLREARALLEELS
jgi:predicted ATPase